MTFLMNSSSFARQAAPHHFFGQGKKETQSDMGGKAHGTDRLQADEWEAVTAEIKKKLEATGAFVRIEVLRPLPEKTDHGDIDFIVERAAADDAEALPTILSNVGIKDRKGDSYRYSWNERYVQVDVAVADDGQLALHHFFGDFGDAGLIIGCYARTLGFRLSIKTGFSCQHTLPDGATFLYKITDEPAVICAYLGLDYETWRDGFASRAALIEWLRPAFPYVQGRPTERPFMQQYLAQTWDTTRKHDKTFCMQRMVEMGHVDGFDQALKNHIRETELKAEFKKRFNGKIVQEYVQKEVGLLLKGAALGSFLERVKEKLREDVIPSEEDVRQAIHSAMDHFLLSK